MTRRTSNPNTLTMITLGIPNATVTAAVIRKVVMLRREATPSGDRATVRRAAPPMARPPEAILRRITAVTLRKSVRTTASFRSDMVARETGRQPTEGGEHYGELSEYQHGLLDGQQGRR